GFHGAGPGAPVGSGHGIRHGNIGELCTRLVGTLRPGFGGVCQGGVICNQPGGRARPNRRWRSGLVRTISQEIRMAPGQKRGLIALLAAPAGVLLMAAIVWRGIFGLFMVVGLLAGVLIIVSLFSSLVSVAVALLPVAKVPFRYNLRNLQVRWKT